MMNFLAVSLIIFAGTSVTAATNSTNATEISCDNKSACDTSVSFFLDLFAFLADTLATRIDQVEALCSEAQSLRPCHAYVEKCVNHSVSDIHIFIKESVKIIDYCQANQPLQLLEKVLTIRNCDAKLNFSLPGFTACDTAFADDFESWSQAFQGEVFQTGMKLQNLCCAFKKYDKCIGAGTTERICGVMKDHGLTPVQSLTNEIYTAFECDKRPACE